MKQMVRIGVFLLLYITVLVGSLMGPTGPWQGAWAITPLDQCPLHNALGQDILKEKRDLAFETRDKIGIETYTKLLQCQYGAPFSVTGERYITIQKSHNIPELVDLSPDIRRQIIQFYWQKFDQAGWLKSGLADISLTPEDIDKNRQRIYDRLALQAQLIHAATASAIIARNIAPEQYATYVNGARKLADDIILNAPTDRPIPVIQLAFIIDAFYELAQLTQLPIYHNAIETLAAHVPQMALSPSPDENMARLYINLILLQYQKPSLDPALPPRQLDLPRAQDIFYMGVLPAMYESGPYIGQWVDPENQALNTRYHIIYFMIRSAIIYTQNYDSQNRFARDLLSAITHNAAAIFTQYKTHKAVQITNMAAYMQCALDDMHAQDNIDDVNALAQWNEGVWGNIWRKRSKNAIKNNIISHFPSENKPGKLLQKSGASPAYITSPFAIICMMRDMDDL